jgi:hypothetical protein
MRLVAGDVASGRYRAADLSPVPAGDTATPSQVSS